MVPAVNILGAPIPRGLAAVDRPWVWTPNPFDFAEACDRTIADRGQLPHPFLPEPFGSDSWLDDSEAEAWLSDLGLESGSLDEREAWLDFCKADSEAPEPIRQHWVQRTRKPHYCDRCKGDIYPTERARVDTLKTASGIASVYLCETCTAPTRGEATAADRNGTKLYDEAEGVAGFAPDGSPC